MKKICILATILFLCVTCRKEADFYPYYGETHKLAYDSYAGQFETVWKNISTGYVFWSLDTTDWDAVLDRYMPEFMDLDSRYANGETIKTKELEALYTSAMGGLIDHHMNIRIYNIHNSTGSTQFFSLRPGRIETAKRDYYIENDTLSMLSFLNGIEAEEDITIGDHLKADANINGTDVAYHYFKILLDDGRVIPYMWQSKAYITPVIQAIDKPEDSNWNAAVLIDTWLKDVATTPRDRLAGFILDNRSNRGGYQDDLDLLVGSFINEEKIILQTRYKEGPGRLEYSPWADYKQKPDMRYHRDITAENIPYVILCDINSISMGEIETIVANAVLPTVYTIGERTYGATGPLQSDMIDLVYDGIFGNRNEGHYVYTSTFQARPYGGEILEGKGYTPDQIVNRKDYNGNYAPQLKAAISYIAQH